MIDFKGEAPANADFKLAIPADAERKTLVGEAFGVSEVRMKELNAKAQTYNPKTTVDAIQVVAHIAVTISEFCYLAYLIGYEDGNDPMSSLLNAMSDGKA